MAAKPRDPLLDLTIRRAADRYEFQLTAGRPMARMIIGLAMLVLVGILVGTGAVPLTQVASVLSLIPKW